MDTWNIDRIYNWYGMAIANEVPHYKFYFDPSDNTFFDLLMKNNQYTIEDKRRLSDEDKILILSKIEKIKNNDTTLVEIKKSKRTLLHLFDQTTSYENYLKRDEEWTFVNDEVKTFLNKHAVDTLTARLIE